MKMFRNVLALAFLTLVGLSKPLSADTLIWACNSDCTETDAYSCCLIPPGTQDCNDYCGWCHPGTSGRDGGECTGYMGIGMPTPSGYLCECGLFPPEG